MPSYEDIDNNKINISTTSLLQNHNFYYDNFSFKAQLENIISLLKQYDNYNLILVDNQDDDLTIYSKENVGLIIKKYSCPPISIATSEPIISNAFWDYLSLNKAQVGSIKEQKLLIIKTLQEFIKGLEGI